MAKLIYSEDFKKRFTNASKNGSTVCAAILKAINTPDNVKDGVRFNYLTTVRVRHGGSGEFVSKSVKITVCNKDFSNKNNPEHGSPVGMWRPENRVPIDLPTLVGAFKSIDGNAFTSDDYKFAASILCVEEQLKCGIYSKMQDIQRGYDGTNYIETYYGDGTLQNSCMRGEATARVAADFYANFAGAKIILVTGASSGKVYGRAMLWPNLTLHPNGADGEAVTGSFLERTYFAYDAVLNIVRDFAKANGVRFRKLRNTYSDKLSFVDVETGRTWDEPVAIHVPVKKWHKGGAPYIDTFSYLFYENGEFLMSNSSRRNGRSNYVADLGTTGTEASMYRRICPACGKVHEGRGVLCPACERALLKSTSVGPVYIGKVDKNHNPVLPKKFVQDAEHLRKLCNEEL